MSISMDQLLKDLSHGTLPLEVACSQLEQLAQASSLQGSILIAKVQSEIIAGRLPHAAGRALLTAIERGAEPRTEKTAVLNEPAQADDDATSMRPAGAAQATAIHSSDSTVQWPPHQVAKTLVRPAPAVEQAAAQIESDETQMRSASVVDAALQSASATVQGDPAAAANETRRTAPAGGTLVHDPDETILTRPQVTPTAARTVQTGGPTEALSAYAATLKAPDKTQVIGERLVQSLDAVAQVHHGQLQPGSIIKHRFVLDTLIGKGGMGLVFSAIDRRKEEAQDPNPRVALKVLNADFQRHPQSFIALQREARKAQTLAHPNVVTVFDFDRDGDAVYMTMELLKGRALEAIVREARGKGIGAKLALPIIRGIAEGLAYAHRKGIVHSDLKPGNVFIADDGTPKILDFGIARAVPSSVTEENRDTFDAGSLGAYTEAYATDEMVDGIDPHPADDMYALGIIGYELVTGFHPYQRHGAPTARKLGIKPPPLKGLKLREARALERCLSFDRKNRPKDAGEFLKLFRGVTALQKATIAVAAVLAVASGFLWYQNYVETSPSIPFAQLPAETQQDFTQKMIDGDRAWALYRSGIAEAVQDAVQLYSAAYELHPRNRDAVKALNRAGDEFLKVFGDTPQRRREAAQNLQERSDYYKKYAPVVDAAK